MLAFLCVCVCVGVHEYVLHGLPVFTKCWHVAGVSPLIQVPSGGALPSSPT